MSIHIKQFGQNTLLTTKYAEAIGINENAFDVDFLGEQKLITAQKSGRGQVYFFNWAQNHQNQIIKKEDVQKTFALRHYRRGGLVAKLSNDAFFYQGLKKTRCYQELSILEFLKNNELNVPTPISGLIKRKAGFYTADLITEVIEHSTELHEQLKSRPVDLSIWFEIGIEIKKMHNLNVCHLDINDKNILLQKSKLKPKIHLIDFDKCFIKPDGNWKQANLARLRRSLDKHQNSYVEGAFTEQNWNQLMSGYQSH